MRAVASLRLLDPRNVEGPAASDALIGDSEGIARVREAVEAAARSGVHVLIEGEAGTGKELCARLVHARSGRTGPFLAWAPGSARDLHAALAAAADGVLYIRELLDVRPETQAHLQRALDEGAAVQVVAATAKDPRRAVAQGLLRAELLRALEGARIGVPPLRERAADVPVLVQHFLSTFCSRRCGCLQGVGEDAMRALSAYSWPGNVAELRGAVEHAVSAGGSPWITLRDLPAVVGGEAARQVAPDDYELPTLADAEARLIRLTLQRFAGNKVRAARSLGISRHKLYERLRKLGLMGADGASSSPGGA